MILCKNGAKIKKQEKKHGYPIIVPIIIYTGNQKWRVPKNSKEKQISNYVFERHKIDIEYNLIDINKLSEQALLEKDTMFGYSMLIEKLESKEKLIENLHTITRLTKNKEKLEKLANIISYLLDDKTMLETTGFKKEELEKIKKELLMVS